MLATLSEILISWTCRSDDTGLQVFHAAIEHFQEKWRPAFRPKMRRSKDALALSAGGGGWRLGGDLS
jgi:hypothetical protein